MEADAARTDQAKFVKWSVEAAIRIGVLFLLVVWALQIIRLFFSLVLWAVILAVAIYPLFATPCAGPAHGPEDWP